jgi:hypothetical protein
MNSAENHFQAIRDYLDGLYDGNVPGSPRSYLTIRESQDMLFIVGPAGDRPVFDIDYQGYPGKWRQAVEHCIAKGLDPTTWQFWYALRLAALEFGVPYRKGLQPTHH